jgi:KDO2-lipid IV(A) lauroyltransferase
MTWKMRLLYALLWLGGLLPLRVLHALGSAFGDMAWLLRSRERRITEINLALMSDQDGALSCQLDARQVLRETGKSAIEIAKVWSGRPQHALRLVREVRGADLFEQALESGKGILIAAPHLGCWELLSYWLAERTPLAIVYRPPRNPEIEPLLIKARGASKVEQVRAEGAGVRSLYRRLSAGGVVGILPDQQPRQGEGEFAPFFGIEALTMVLLPRLAERTGACVLFAFAERLPRGQGFRIHVQAAPSRVADADLRIACSALNEGVEHCVRAAPMQYQWHYKRYSISPPGPKRRLYAAVPEARGQAGH